MINESLTAQAERESHEQSERYTTLNIDGLISNLLKIEVKK